MKSFLQKNSGSFWKIKTVFFLSFFILLFFSLSCFVRANESFSGGDADVWKKLESQKSDKDTWERLKNFKDETIKKKIIPKLPKGKKSEEKKPFLEI